MPPSAISTPSPSGAAHTKLVSMSLYWGGMGQSCGDGMKFLAFTPAASFLRMLPLFACAQPLFLRAFNSSGSQNFTFSPRC